MNSTPHPETIELHRTPISPSSSLALDGEPRSGQEVAGQLISARTDLEAVNSWLSLHRHQPLTLDSYRREAERLLLWCSRVRRCQLADLRVEDLTAFEQFLANPPHSPEWIINWRPAGDPRRPPGQPGPRRRPRRGDPNWAPFAGPLKPASVRKSMNALRALFGYLHKARYLLGDPLSIKPKTRPPTAAAVWRYLPPNCWAEVQNTIAAMPKVTTRERSSAARARWLFSLLYVGGMRVSELCSGTMGDFQEQMGTDGKVRCWIAVTGKGGKQRLIPSTPDLLEELARYRLFLGLRPKPHPGEPTPLVPAAIGEGKPITRQAVHKVVKIIVADTAARLRESGDPFKEAEAAHIEQASTHWLRHTAASMQMRTMGAISTRDNLGHSSIATTNIYSHVEHELRHDETSQAHRLNWEDGEAPGR